MPSETTTSATMVIEYELTKDAAATANDQLNRRSSQLFRDMLNPILAVFVGPSVARYLFSHPHYRSAMWLFVLGALFYVWLAHPLIGEKANRFVTKYPGLYGWHRAAINRSWFEHATSLAEQRMAWSEVSGIWRLPSAIVIATEEATECIPVSYFGSADQADEFARLATRYRWGDSEPTKETVWQRSVAPTPPTDALTAAYLASEPYAGPSLAHGETASVLLDVTWADDRACYWRWEALIYRPWLLIGLIAAVMSFTAGVMSNAVWGIGVFALTVVILLHSDYRYRHRMFDQMRPTQKPRRFETDFKRFVWSSDESTTNSDIAAVTNVAQRRDGSIYIFRKQLPEIILPARALGSATDRKVFCDKLVMGWKTARDKAGGHGI